jgi:hypothetical protein
VSLPQLDDPEVMLCEDMALFYDNPLGFVMYAYPWDTEPSIQVVKLVEPWASKYDCKWGPDKWACEYLERLGDEVRKRGFNGTDAVTPIRIAVSSGHGVGKSAMSGWLVDWIMSTRPLAQGTVTANTSAQLETKTWSQVAKWTKMCVTAHWFNLHTGRGSMKLAHKDYPEKWFCTAQTCREENSESFAGQHAVSSTSFYINDEGSAIADIIYTVQDGGLTDGEPMQFNFGNPTRNTGRFRECWRKFRKRWITFNIDSREVQITNKEYLAGQVADHGEDSDTVKVRVRGVFPSQSFKQFISEADVEAAERVHLNKKQYSFAPVVLGVDPAWTGDDEFVIFLRQGLYSKLLGHWEKNDDDIQMANILARLEDDYEADAVHVDGGFGTGIVSAGKAMGRTWQIIWFSSKSPDPGCMNLRAHMWNEMKRWLKDGGSIEEDSILHQDLIGPETVPRIDGKILLESKEDMKRRDIPSPNRGDGLALTFAMPVVKPDMNHNVPLRKAKHDFDPYALGVVH